MRNGKEKRKRRIMLSLLVIFLLCCGCGQQEDEGAESAGTENAGAESTGTENVRMDSAGGGTDWPGEMNISNIYPSAAVEMAPLLNYEDPETENLAGMLQEKCGGMMVQLEAGKYLGSGILYRQEDDVLLILTAGHVLSDGADAVKVTFVDGWETETTDFELSGLADMAVIRVPVPQVPAHRLEEYFLANMDKAVFDGIQAEDGCIVMGCRSGVAEDAYEGVVIEPWIYMEDYEQYMMWVKANGKPGMSGGGLFDRRGRLLGILSGRSEDGEWAVVPLSFVLAEY